jgi:hypothetical protein
VALKASLSSSNASPATQASLSLSLSTRKQAGGQTGIAFQIDSMGAEVQVRTVRGEGHGEGGAEEGGDGNDVGA